MTDTFDKTKSVALIGMMGTFKTSAGKKLAELLSCDFLDLDEMIEHETGQTIAKIFAEKGEEAFRALETECLAKAVTAAFCVISTGGGAPLRSENAAFLRAHCLSVYLKADAQAIVSRVGDASTRPLLKNNLSAESVQTLMNARHAAYAALADYTLDNTNLTSTQTAWQIYDFIKNAAIPKNPLPNSTK